MRWRCVVASFPFRMRCCEPMLTLDMLGVTGQRYRGQLQEYVRDHDDRAPGEQRIAHGRPGSFRIRPSHQLETDAHGCRQSTAQWCGSLSLSSHSF